MPRALSKVIYKPDPNSTDEFIVIVNNDEYKKWKDGDTTLPLAEVVDSFQVFHSGTGTQGILGTPSKQQLDTVFETHKDVDVVEKILKEGRFQTGEGIAGHHGNFNDTRGSAVIDTKGGRNTSGAGGGF